MKYHYVYGITHKLLAIKYIGVRSSNISPNKDLGHGGYISCSCNKKFIEEQLLYPDRFLYEVLKEFDERGEAVNYEIELHARYNVKTNPDFYNLSNQTTIRFDVSGCTYVKGTHNMGKYVRTNEHKKKMSIATKGHVKTEEHKKNISANHADMSGENNPMYGRVGMLSGFYGKCHSDAHKNKMSLLMSKPKEITNCPFCNRIISVNGLPRHTPHCNFNYDHASKIDKIIFQEPLW